MGDPQGAAERKKLTMIVTQLTTSDETPLEPTSSFASMYNVIVYRLSSFYKHRPSHSIFGSRKSMMFFTRFSGRQLIILFLEMLLAFAWWVIRNRRRRTDDLIRKGITERQEMVDLYLRQACGSFVSLIIGYLADTYFTIYFMAVFNVILHFFMCSIMIMEEMIKKGDYDLYQSFVSDTLSVLIIPLKATDFTRIVYALQILGRKETKITLTYIFITVWVGERAVSGIFATIISLLDIGWTNKVQLSFIISGMALVLYVYILRPATYKFTISHGSVGNDFIGCIVTAIWTRYRYKQFITSKPDNWLDYAEVKYERVKITRAMEVLKLYSLIIPTVGFSLYAAPRSDFYLVLWDRFVPSGLFIKTGIYNGASIITFIAMGSTQFIVIPFLEKLGIKSTFARRFFFGYLCALISMAYTTSLLPHLEEVTPGTRTGIIRIVNVRSDSVRLISLEKRLGTFEHVIKTQEDVILTLSITESTLFKVKIIFPLGVSMTTYISANPDLYRGYVVLDPPGMASMGHLPIRELKAGMNKPNLPKLYIFNTLNKNATVEFRMGSISYQFPSQPGARDKNLVVSQMVPGTYLIRTMEFESGGTKSLSMEAGGFYGIIVHETGVDTLLTSDTLVVKNTMDSNFIFGISIPYGIALTLSYGPLRALVVYNAPEGMEGLSFGFLDFIDNVPFWIIWIGHITWHKFISSFSLCVYSVLETVLMLICVFVHARFNYWYKWG